MGKASVLVEILCENDFVLPVRTLVDGVVIEINQRLTPAILSQPEGYVAVINPVRKFKPDPNVFEEVLLTHQQ